MKKVLGFLRRTWKKLIFGIGFICAIINFAFGTRSAIDWAIIVLFGIDLILELITVLIKPISNRVLAYKILKSYKQGFNTMKKAHQIRYKLYFIGNSNQVKEYSNLIEDMGRCLISYSEDELTQEVLSSKQLEDIIELDGLVQQMLSIENPNMIKGLL